jgi:2-polyprenyl-3-methyl-5-hydroxy-6-metoxy-1,4-benzoquinol methylase
MNIPPQDSQRQFWDDWVTRSFAWQTNPDNQRRGYYVLREVAKRHVADLRVLDVGCGSGWLSVELERYGKVTAIDLSPKAIQELQKLHPSIHWISGDFFSVDLPEKAYDVVTCLETIAHVPDQEAFARKIAEVTRPGGHLLLTTQNEYIWSRTSWLQPPGEGQIRNWPSHSRLLQLFAPYFATEEILTCAPGGDRGLPRLFTIASVALSGIEYSVRHGG